MTPAVTHSATQRLFRKRRAKVWRPAVAACELGGLRIHDLRHSAASLMISSGAQVKAVQRALGHASAAITLDVYAGLFDDDLEALADAMTERYGEADAAHAGLGKKACIHRNFRTLFLFQGVNGVLEQVDENLLQLIDVCLNDR